MLRWTWYPLSIITLYFNYLFLIYFLLNYKLHKARENVCHVHHYILDSEHGAMGIYWLINISIWSDRLLVYASTLWFKLSFLSAMPVSSFLALLILIHVLRQLSHLQEDIPKPSAFVKYPPSSHCFPYYNDTFTYLCLSLNFYLYMNDIFMYLFLSLHHFSITRIFPHNCFYRQHHSVWRHDRY